MNGISVKTDKSEYVVGETVVITGKLSTIGGTVRLDVYDTNGVPYDSNIQVKTDKKGFYSHDLIFIDNPISMPIPEFKSIEESGAFAIVATHDNVKANTTFGVNLPQE